ncbi:MAG: aspartate/glutamate racemase family protein [Pseudomonadota bacterium]
MTRFAYHLEAPAGPALGLVVLEADATIEHDFRRILPASARLHISRVPSAPDVTSETLQAMEAHLPAAAGLLPASVDFDTIGYGCTSGTAQIGAGRIAELVRRGKPCRTVTEPLSALVAACAALGLNRLAFLSPYVDPVSERLRGALARAGIATPVFGTFAEQEEARVAQIAPASTRAAGATLVSQAGAGEVDALFLSCTNLRTLAVIDALEAETGLPVLSSNQVLAWHMARLADPGLALTGPGRLLQNVTGFAPPAGAASAAL